MINKVITNVIRCNYATYTDEDFTSECIPPAILKIENEQDE